MATIVAIAAIGAAGVGAVSSIQQGRAAKRVGEQNAQLALGRAKLEEARFRRDQRRRLGRIRAGIGARGITVEGSPLALLADQAAEIEEDALLIRFGGDVAAAEARTRGSFAKAAGISRGLSLLGTAAGFAGQAGESLLDGGGSTAT